MVISYELKRVETDTSYKGKLYLVNTPQGRILHNSAEEIQVFILISLGISGINFG